MGSGDDDGGHHVGRLVVRPCDVVGREGHGQVAPVTQCGGEPVQGSGVFGVAPSMSCTLLVPGTAGSASRDSTSIRASGAGRGVIGAASSGLDVTGGSDGAGGDERLNSGCEHPESLTPPRWWRRPGLHGCFGASSDTLGYRPLANAAEVSAAAAALIAASPTTPVARISRSQCSSQGPFDRLDSGPRLPAIQVVTFHRHSTANMKRRSPVALEYPPRDSWRGKGAQHG